MGQGLEEGNVIDAKMSDMVMSTDAVDKEADGKALNINVMKKLVIGSLEKSGVDHEKRFETIGGHTGSGDSGMFFGNAHIKKTIGESGLNNRQTRAAAHSGSENDDALIFGHQREELASDEVVGGRGDCWGIMREKIGFNTVVVDWIMS